MKQIHITRSNAGVTFEEVSIDPTENVFFTNEDTQSEHWPTFSPNKLGKAPSANSDALPVPPPASAKGKSPPPLYHFEYGCKLHSNEHGVINVFPVLAAVANTSLKNATKGNPIQEQQLVTGGKNPYSVTDRQFQIAGPNPSSGQGNIGPGLNLSQKADANGVWGLYVSGTPTVSGTYSFTFTVDDAMGGNLQQTVYTMKVS